MSARVTRKRARLLVADTGDDAVRVDGKAEDPEKPSDALGDGAVGQDGVEAQKDEEFWLQDGTVILGARDVEFRVYAGLLANHSPVFKEILARPHPTRSLPMSGGENVLCPVVTLTDSPEDLRHLLRAYMPTSDITFYDAKAPSFASISASIRLGHKYKAAALYNQSLQYLKTWYTTDLDVWNGHHQWVPPGWDRSDVIGVVNLARLVGEPSLLPTALLDCIALGDAIIQGAAREDGTREHLTIEDLGICFKASSALQKASTAMVLRTLTYAPKCKDGAPCRHALKKAVADLAEHMESTSNGAPFLWYNLYFGTGYTIVVCTLCKRGMDRVFRDERTKMWRRLPELMGVEVSGWCQVESVANAEQN